MANRFVGLAQLMALSERFQVVGGPRVRPWALTFALLLFLLSCVFDPADRVLGLKAWLFLLCWSLTLLAAIGSNAKASIPRSLLIYTVAFVAVPVLSIVTYIFSGGGWPYEGFHLLKGYVLVTLAPLLVLNRIDLLPRLCVVLTALAAVIIAVFSVLLLRPELYVALHSFGARTGIVLPDIRNYGSGLTLLQVYFVTSPMLAISIAYYFSQAHSSSAVGVRVAYLGLVLVNVAGMFLAGTRNNLMVAAMLPVALWFIYAKNKVLASVLGLAAFAVLSFSFIDELSAFFNPAEYSNSIKLSLLGDYLRILSDPRVLIFGHGLGAYEYWDAKGMTSYISELTYLEMIRNFGLPGALIMLALLLFPIWHAFTKTRSQAQRGLAVGFAFYLVMCFSNPNLFSSMGILILCVVLTRVYLPASAARDLAAGGRQ